VSDLSAEDRVWDDQESDPSTSLTNPVSVDGPLIHAASTMPRATLSDVARLAGVSGKTVSRVVSGQDKVSAATRQRVLDAAQRLRFRPNHLARDLRRGGSSTIVGFVIGDLANPFYSQLAAGVEREVAQHALTMIIAATDDDPSREALVVAAMLERRVSSLLIVPIATDQSYLEGERQLGTPVVCIDRPARNLAADSVIFANREGAAEAVRSLIDHGHRRIAFVGSSESLYTHSERLAGYREALRAAGLTGSHAWERTDAPDAESAERATRELLQLGIDAPTAILAGNNRASMGVMRALGDTDASVAFIGFDDFDLAQTLGISVVAHDPEEMGRRAARMSILRKADLFSSPTQLVLPTRLVKRGSGEISPSTTASGQWSARSLRFR
jgi:LacI family transcriptional regulator